MTLWLCALLFADMLMTVRGTDGSQCNLQKSATTSIRATYYCHTADNQQLFSGVVTASSAHNATGSVVFGMDTIVCLLGINTTGASRKIGSLGNVPPQGIAWSCTGDGKTSITGTAVWP